MTSKKQIKQINEWKKENVKRIAFEVKKDYYENILKPIAEKENEPINTFIKKSINERIERLKGSKGTEKQL